MSSSTAENLTEDIGRSPEGSSRVPNIHIAGVGQFIQIGSVAGGAGGSGGGYGGPVYIGSQRPMAFEPHSTSDAPRNSEEPEGEYNFHNSDPSTAMESDVLHSLFGDISLVNLTSGLSYELDNLLWSIRVPLGDVRFQTIHKSPKATEAFIHMLYEHRYDTALTNAFRDYVLGSTGLFYLLTAQARAEAVRRKSQMIERRPLAGRRSPGDGYHAAYSNSANPLSFKVEITLKNLGFYIITFSCTTTDGERCDGVVEPGQLKPMEFRLNVPYNFELYSGRERKVIGRAFSRREDFDLNVFFH